MITDWLDGYLARKNNLITSFGKIADPIADKLLTGAAFVVLSMLGELWWWVTIVILVREWGITVMRLFIIKYGVMAASKGGKLKTVLQTVALVLMILPLGQLGSWGSVARLPGDGRCGGRDRSNRYRLRRQGHAAAPRLLRGSGEVALHGRDKCPGP